MPLTALERQKKIPISDYVKLRDAVRKTLLLGRQRIEQEKVRTYWETGRLLNQHVKISSSSRPDYGRQVVSRLSRDLEISERVLYYTVGFARAFPNLNRRSNLVWSHYRALTSVPDDKVRRELMERAARHGWTSEQLIEKIKKEIREESSTPLPHPPKEIAAFKPKRGTLNAYRVVLSEVLLMDLGFSSFIERPALKSGRFKEGDIIVVATRRDAARADVAPRPTRRGVREAISILKNATPADLYTYTAEVEKIIDADTYWLWIHIGFDIWMRQKVRLRGIDAPEIGTQAGLAAKRFAESQLASSDPSIYKPVTVTTTKPDKYDRYLSDIWIGDTNLNQLLLSSGHARLMPKVSDDLWNETNWGRF